MKRPAKPKIIHHIYLFKGGCSPKLAYILEGLEENIFF
jgi:hypothetical protein